MVPSDVRKTLIDAGYITVGLGVLGFQQVQERGREVRKHVDGLTDKVEGYVGDHARTAQTTVTTRVGGPARDMQNRVTDSARDVQNRVTDSARGVQTRVADSGRKIDERSRAAKDAASTQVRATVAKAGEVGSEVAKRFEPVVEQVQSQIGDLPERVVPAMEPVAARVREITGSAA
jgi:gas vesicle protein